MGSRVITGVIDNANYAMSLAYRCSYFSTQFQPTNRAVGCKFLSSSSIQFCNWKVVTESALHYSVLRVHCWVYWWMLVIDRLLPNDSLISQTNETTLSLGHCKYRKARRDTVQGSHTVLTIVWFWSRFIRNDKKKTTLFQFIAKATQTNILQAWIRRNCCFDRLFWDTR